MKYTKRIESVGDASIVEHFVEGDYEEVLALFTELEAKDAVAYLNDQFHTMNINNIQNQNTL